MPSYRLVVIVLIAIVGSGCDASGLTLSDADARIDLPGEPDGVRDVPPDTGYPDGMKPIPPSTYTWTGCPDPLPPGSPTDPVVDAVLLVEDMEDGFPVEGVQLEVFFTNTVSGEPDLGVADLDPTDTDGRVIATVPTGRWIAVRVIGDATPLYPPGVVMQSVAFDVETPVADGGLVPIRSVSQATYMLISTVFGITPDPSLGLLFGVLRDCASVPIEDATARLYRPPGERCGTDSSCLDRYFIDDVPAMDQLWTSEDGMFALLQIPPLDGFDLELHGIVSGSSCTGGLVVIGEHGSVHVMENTISFVGVTCTDLDDVPWSERCVY